MANELRHSDVGTALSKTEWEAVGSHVLNSQAAGDLIYASSTSQLSRLAIGSANQFLVTNAGGTAPTWTSSPAVATAITPDASDGATLGTAALEWSDLYLADAAVIYFGDDDDVTLTHVHNAGLLLSSTDQLQFGDSGTYIYQSTDGQLDLVADTEIQIAATTIDINGALALNGAITGATNITLSGELDAASLDISGSADVDGTMEADAYTVAGVTLAEYIADTVGAMVSSNTETGITVTYEDGDNTLDFVIGTLNQDTTGNAGTVTVVDSTDTSSYIAMFDSATGSLAAKTDAGITYNAGTGMLTATGFTGPLTGNASGTAATVTTAAQPNITSLGTLTTLTVDDVNINGKVITMTGDTSDTAVFTAGTNGTLSIVTTDAAAAAANIQITADGTVDIDSAGVLTLDSGAAINIEPASGSAILLDGTISVDAGVVTGATSITSTAFVGTLSTANQSNITGVSTITSGTWQGTAIATAYIADNAITLAKMAHGTDGNLITYDANGAPAVVATGNDGQILVSAGAGQPPAFETVAGGGSATFTADGAIAEGAMVTSSSTAGRVKQATTGHGTWSQISHKLAVSADAELFLGGQSSIIYCDDSSTAANNRVAVAYRDNAASNYLVIQIGQYIAADEQVVWGPRTVLISASTEQVTAVWDGVRDRIVIVYGDGSNGDLKSTVCAIDTSTSGQSSVIHTSGNNAPGTSIAVDRSAISMDSVARIAVVANCDDTDGNAGHILVTWDSGTRIKALVGITSGTYYDDVTWDDTVQTVDNQHNHYNDSLAWDTNIDRGISTYYGSSATDLHYRVIEIENDDTISVGAEGTIGSSATPMGVNSKTSVVFDDDTNNVVVVYMQSDRHYLIAGTLATGNTASWGTAVSLDVWFGAKPTFGGNDGYLMTVDTDSNQIVLVGAVGGHYGTDGSLSMSQLEGRLPISPGTVRSFGVYLASLSGTAVTVVNAEPMLVAGQNIKQTWVQPQQMTARQNTPEYRVRSITYDHVANRTYITWSIEWPGGLGAGGYNNTQWLGVCKVLKAPYTPPSWIGDTGFIGFATAAAINGAAVTVTVAGGTNENQSSLTAGQRYVIFDDGILRKPSDLVNKDLISSDTRTGSLYDIKQTRASFSIWKHEVGVATDTDKLFINFHGGLE